MPSHLAHRQGISVPSNLRGQCSAIAWRSTSFGVLNAFIQPAHSHKNGRLGSIFTGCCCVDGCCGGRDAIELLRGGVGDARATVPWLASPLVNNNGGVLLLACRVTRTVAAALLLLGSIPLEVRTVLCCCVVVLLL